jgi:histone H3/H4
MSESQELMECIGREAMERLCRKFGGQRVYVPHEVPILRRDERIREIFAHELRHGSTCMSAYQTAAESYALSVRRVQQIVATN